MRNYVARFALGDTARDGISGYEGVVVVAITFWINNCERVTLQARGLHEGKPFEAQTFDAPSVTPRQAHRAAPAPGEDGRPDAQSGSTVMWVPTAPERCPCGNNRLAEVTTFGGDRKWMCLKCGRVLTDDPSKMTLRVPINFITPEKPKG